ncbi:hypothetical protein WA026_010364 [Henosepilachna vigintioctopunctata]|uniref:Single domain-containing protein n=1 Tax=Henosepilachna vigintioctopunctata TaxID=420089 RepID=A0AAW1V4T5_9CUCU
MKLIFLTLIALCLAVHTEGWVGRGKTDADKLKDHPNECWVENIGYFKNGETKRDPNQCAEVKCEGNGEYSITGCIKVNVEDPCTVNDGDLSKPFPDCCFEIKCPEKTVKQ